MGKRKRLTALLCAVVMALTLLPVQAWATGETEGTRYRAWYDAATGETHREALPEGTMLQPFPADEQSDIALFAEDEEPDIDPYFLEISEYLSRYGYSTLQSMGDDTLLQVYAQLLWIASNYLTDAYFLIDKATISTEKAELVTQAFYADWPEIFWMWPGCLYTEDEPEVCVGLDMGYNDHFNNRKQEQQLFLSAANSILAGMPADGTDYEKELYLHDALVKHVTYDDAYVEEQNAYSALVNGMAVCSGYAFALQYLLMRAGIESYYVVGTAGEDENGDPVGHAWNIARIGGTWYYVDATWDDYDDDTPYHAYFNITTAMLEAEHTLDAPPYNVTLPVCTATDAFYYAVNGSMISMSDEGLVEKIAELLMENDCAVWLYVTDDDPAQAAWTWYIENEAAVLKALRATGECSLEALGNEVLLTFAGDFDPPARGNVNGDNKISISDVQLLYTYLTTGVYEGDMIAYYFRSAADINGDEHIDVYDLQALYEIVCGIG